MTEIVRTIPVLPAELDDQPVTWHGWELAPVLSHGEQGCDICDHEGPLSLAEGRGEDRTRYVAIRCRRCQQTRVMTRDRTKLQPLGGHIYVWESPAQAIGADL